MRLIDAYEAKAVIKDLRKTIDREIPGATLGTVMGLISCYIDAQPTIDAEPVRHGEWQKTPSTSDEYELKYECPFCKFEIILEGYGDEGIFNYCPRCGAKMDGGTEKR